MQACHSEAAGVWKARGDVRFLEPLEQVGAGRLIRYSEQMRVRLLFFGVLRERFGVSDETVALPDGAVVTDLLELLRERTSNPLAGTSFNERLWRSLAVAVNREYCPAATKLQDGDEVALLPPVSGGCECR